MDMGVERNWHHFSVEQVIGELSVDVDQGLNSKEAQDRLDRYGPNKLTEHVGESPFIIFLRQFQQPLVYILLVAAVGTGLLQEWADMAVILAVVLLNGITGFVQESKALKAIKALSSSSVVESTVLRDGVRKRISSEDIVIGDIVVLQSGDKTPADLRLLKIRELQVDESALTGESLPVQKGVEALPVDTVLADRRCMAYASTLITYGVGTGVVIGTGDRTEIGKINKMISSADVLATPLTRKIAQLSHALLWIILAICGVSFIVGIMRGYPLPAVFIGVVALAVGAIPEGLPAVVTVTLAIGVATMARRRAIVRKMPAVETLGSTTVICSDKTGTLTQNAMLVKEILAGDKIYGVSGIGYSSEGQFNIDGSPIDVQPPDLMEILKAGLLCNDSRLTETDDGYRVEGDPTEGALIAAAGKAGLRIDAVEKDLPRIDAIPFESQYQYMATLHQAGPNRIIYIKGSLESILSRSDLKKNGYETDAGSIEKTASEMAAKGLRVLAFARAVTTSSKDAIDHPDVADGLVFLGLQGMVDPPRPEAVEAAASCQNAGIQVKMITGDHVVTASAIAGELDLKGEVDASGTPVGITGRELGKLDDDALEDRAANLSVFARVTPEQKLRLVKALQNRGHIVAMTGDGVNDAPALRQADIGVAMGITGTEVTKEAADMVLTDDNFASIQAAVEEGRRVYDNLIKFITWTLPTNLCEAIVILVAVFIGLQLPVTPLQILWINMTTAILLGAALAFEKKEPGIMARPPRPPKAPILERRLIIRVLYMGSLISLATYLVFNMAESRGASIDVSRTAAVNMIVFGEISFLFCCRSLRSSLFKIGFFSNLWLIGGVMSMIGIQALFTYAPFMNQIFETAPLSLRGWLLIVAAAVVIFAVGEFEKWFIHDRQE